MIPQQQSKQPGIDCAYAKGSYILPATFIRQMNEFVMSGPYSKTFHVNPRKIGICAPSLKIK